MYFCNIRSCSQFSLLGRAAFRARHRNFAVDLLIDVRAGRQAVSNRRAWTSARHGLPGLPQFVVLAGCQGMCLQQLGACSVASEFLFGTSHLTYSNSPQCLKTAIGQRIRKEKPRCVTLRPPQLLQLEPPCRHLEHLCRSILFVPLLSRLLCARPPPQQRPVIFCQLVRLLGQCLLGRVMLPQLRPCDLQHG